MEASIITTRASLLRCRRCKSPDGYTVGEPCLHCKYKETNTLLIKRAKELRYRLMPLMKQREFVHGLKTRRFSRSLPKYGRIAGLLLDYEYAYPLLFCPKTVQI